MWLKMIEEVNGQEIVKDHRDMDVQLKSFIPASVQTSYTTEPVLGVPGEIYTSGEHGTRNIRASFLAVGRDHLDLQLIRDEFYEFMAMEKPKRIIDMRQPGKMWEVVPTGEFTMEYVNQSTTAATFEVGLMSFSPYAKSVVRTSEGEFRFDSDKLQFGMGLPTEDLVYKFNATRFRVFNAGNVPVTLRNQDAVITFKGVSARLRIRNLTSGSDWRITDGTLTRESDVLKLSRGCRVERNGLSIARHTNLAAMVLLPGWNEFQIEGTSGSIEVAFDFRFYFL